MSIRQQGQFLQADFFDNTGGINTSDSPFLVKDSQATGGQNFAYVLQGGIRKIFGKTKINSSADSALKTLGASQHVTAAGTKTAIRAADRKIQAVNLTAGTFTNLTEDTATASSNILGASSTKPMSWSQFNTTSSNVLWGVGGDMAGIWGVYSSTKVTKNGAELPTGTISASKAGGSSTFASTGTYWYGVALRKKSTQAVSNVVLDTSVTITATTDAVTVSLASFGAVDVTKYDQLWLYRSATNGVTGFTTGDIVSKTDITGGVPGSLADTGTYLLTAQNIPRANSTLLDQAVLPAGTPTALTTWKRRLVTAIDSTIYLSDVNKPEAWPGLNTITVPSGGPITGLAVISFTTPTSQSIDELLVVFKERELWVVTGSSSSDWALKFIDSVGCVNQPLVIAANGYLAWIDYRGIYLWDGSGKPIYCSRTVEDLFQKDGNIDKSKLSYAWGVFYRQTSEIIWTLSNLTDGEQLFTIKMDLKLTLPQVQSQLSGRVLDAVLIFDVQAAALYSGASFIPSGSTEEILFAGDGSGYTYEMFDALDDAGADIDFQYETKFHDLGSPGTAKRYHKVIVWTEDSTDADLTLEYWSNYVSGTDEKSTQTAPISKQVREALWDEAYWDAAYWDLSVRGFNPVVFNLYSSKNSIEGDCIKLRFKQQDSNAPLTIAGYSIIFTEIGLRK